MQTTPLSLGLIMTAAIAVFFFVERFLMERRWKKLFEEIKNISAMGWISLKSQEGGWINSHLNWKRSKANLPYRSKKDSGRGWLFTLPAEDPERFGEFYVSGEGLIKGLRMKQGGLPPVRLS